jgi:methionyl-tRNA formyltransferase
MAMEAGLDTGPVLLERRITIGLLDNAEVLAGRLAALTADLLLEALPRIVEAGPGPESERWRRLGVQAQSENGMTYARQLGKEDAVVDWSGSALDIHRRVMALYPGAHTLWKGRRLKLLATEPLVERLQGELSAQAAALCGRWGAGEGSGGGGGGRTDAGEVLAVAPGEGLVIATGGCPLLLRDAQLEGKRPCRGQALIQQLNARPGERMGLAAGS